MKNLRNLTYLEEYRPSKLTNVSKIGAGAAIGLALELLSSTATTESEGSVYCKGVIEGVEIEITLC